MASAASGRCWSSLPALTAPPGDAASPGLATVSLERTDLLEADLLIGLLDGDFAAAFDALETDPVSSGLDLVRRGGFVRPSTDDGRAVSRPHRTVPADRARGPGPRAPSVTTRP